MNNKNLVDKQRDEITNWVETVNNLRKEQIDKDLTISQKEEELNKLTLEKQDEYDLLTKQITDLENELKDKTERLNTIEGDVENKKDLEKSLLEKENTLKQLKEERDLYERNYNKQILEKESIENDLKSKQHNNEVLLIEKMEIYQQYEKEKEKNENINRELTQLKLRSKALTKAKEDIEKLFNEVDLKGFKRKCETMKETENLIKKAVLRVEAAHSDMKNY